ncbi:unnamed protein product [Rhizophagus irregularis]|uniref:Uncharacterized protein n=1 Tax=Rhizophagus irregularis TaxID=588596 RepID=A0A915ZVV1_9GLOM|nr:unnamed protein product [Rhizophagus irregularis]
MSKDTSKNINKKGEKEGTERNERDVFYLVPPNVDEEETALRTSNTSSETLRSPFNTKSSSSSPSTLRSPFNTKSSSSPSASRTSLSNTKSSSSPSASRTSLSNTKSSSSPSASQTSLSNTKSSSSLSASRTSLFNTKSSSNIIKSKLAGLQVKILKIHLPKLMILDESQVEATETLRSLEKNLSNFDLKVENGILRADNMELQYKIDKLNKELEESKELNEMLIKINEEFGKENDRLYERIDFYKNLRMPRSMKKSSKPKRKHQRNNDSEDSDDEIIDVDVEMDEKDDEKDDKDARLKTFFREVLDPYSFTQQNAQLTRRRNYDDTLQNFDVQPLNDAPQWTCVEPGNGNVVYDSDIGYESIYDDYMYDDAETF